MMSGPRPVLGVRGNPPDGNPLGNVDGKPEGSDDADDGTADGSDDPLAGGRPPPLVGVRSALVAASAAPASDGLDAALETPRG